MSYLVLARRFRPQTFDDIIGQEHVTQTLKNAITSGRVAHAFLFSGARGVGKTTAARVLAKALNCARGGPTTEPCGECEQCRGIAESRAVDVQEIDGASNNSVDDVRALRETVPYQPSSGRFKIYIVDEVHMLTQSAFNALLKTLEEPPPHVKFIFATTEPHKIPVTILSRCQRYDFRLVPTALIQRRLESILSAEGVDAEESALSLLAREAQGSMRDALSLLDQALAFSTERLNAQEVARLLGVADRQLLFQLSAALLASDAAGVLRAVDGAVTFGCDLTRFSHDVLRHLRNLVIVAQCPGERELVDVSEEEYAELKSQASGRDVAELHRLFLLFSKSTEEVARSSQPRLLLEMSLARLASLEPMRSLEVLAQRLERLASGRGAAAPQPTRRPVERQPTSRLAAPPAGPISRQAARPPEAPFPENPEPPRRAEAEPGPRQPPLVAGPPQSAPAAGADEGSSIKERWAELLGHIKGASAPLYHLLRYAEPVEISRAKVCLRLPDEPFFRGEAKNPQRLQGLKAACQTIFNAEVPVELDVVEGNRGTVEREHIQHAAKEQDRRREAMEHSAVRAVLSEFEGARIDSIRLHDKKRES